MHSLYRQMEMELHCLEVVSEAAGNVAMLTNYLAAEDDHCVYAKDGMCTGTE